MSTSKRAASRREEQKRIRQTHLPSTRKKQRRRKRAPRRTLWLWGGFGVLIVAVVIWIIISTTQQAAPITGIITMGGLSQEHKTGTLTYSQTPPLGGAHNAAWQNCGIYSSPIANENAVHSLEHGAVWVTYQPELSSGTIDHLRSLIRGQTYTLFSPYPGLPAPIVLSGWGVQLKVRDANDPRIAQFLAKYRQGPQAPEQGASCTGGVGTPDEP